MNVNGYNTIDINDKKVYQKITKALKNNKPILFSNVTFNNVTMSYFSNIIFLKHDDDNEKNYYETYLIAGVSSGVLKIYDDNSYTIE